MEDGNTLSFIKKLLGIRPQLVAFACYAWNTRAVASICRWLRKVMPRTVIVLGKGVKRIHILDPTLQANANTEELCSFLLAQNLKGIELSAEFYAELVTPDNIARCGKQASGIVCRLVKTNLNVISTLFLYLWRCVC